MSLTYEEHIELIRKSNPNGFILTDETFTELLENMRWVIEEQMLNIKACKHMWE